MTLEAGTRVGKYEIRELLGAGGMGEVYLARDTELGRTVALKILPGAVVEDRQRMSRFTREARAASALNHPNILTIYDVGHEGPLHFIAAEFIEGDTLERRARGGALGAAEVLDVAAQTADALAAAHEAGIVHRDVKPENVMVRRRDGYVKVLDFGLAKLAAPQPASVDTEAPTEARVATEPGLVMGTVPYMSPEQARGERLDARTDVFSYGVMLYELASGRHPFRRASYAETVSAILTNEPPFDKDLADAPEGLREVVRRCLEKDRERRYRDAAELLRDVRALRQSQGDAERDGRRLPPAGGGAPTRVGASVDTARQDAEARALEAVGARGGACVDTAREGGETRALEAVRTRGGAGSSRRKLLLVGALALGLGVLGAAAVWLARTREAPFAPLEVGRVTQMTLWPGLDDYPAISPDGNSVAYCSDHGGGFEIYVKALTPGSKEVQLTSGDGQNFQPAWSPDGRQIAFYSKTRGGIWVVPASGGEARQLTEFGSAPAWSPDGKLIAFQSNLLSDLGPTARNALTPSTLWLVPAAGGEPRQLTQVGNPVGGHGAPSFSPDGKLITFEVDEYNSASPWTMPASGGEPKRLSPSRRGYAPVFTPDGRSVLYTETGNVFQVRVSPSGEPAGEPSVIKDLAAGRTSFIRRLSLSADGKRVAYSVLNRSENISSVPVRPGTFEPAGVPVALITNASSRNIHPVFSPDGGRIAFSSCNLSGSACDVWLANADGGEQAQLTTAESNEQMAAWLPDAQQVAFVSDRLGRMTYWAINLNTRRERMLFDFGEGLDYMRLSPDGGRIAFNYKGRDGIINVWVASLAGGGARQLTFDKEQAGFTAWSPDGKYLALQVKRGDDSHLVVMPSEGGEPVQLTGDKGLSWVFGWSPDGDRVLFAGFRDGLWNVWWVSRTTRRQQRLTDYRKLNSFVRYPSWSPKGDQIIYQYSEATGNVWVADLK